MKRESWWVWAIPLFVAVVLTVFAYPSLYRRHQVDESWWPLIEGTIVPGLAAAASTAVAVAAWRTSKSAADLARMTARSEAERLDREGRRTLVRHVDEWIIASAAALLDDPLTGMKRVSEGSIALRREIRVMDGTYEVEATAAATWQWFKRVNDELSAITARSLNHGVLAYSAADSARMDLLRWGNADDAEAIRNAFFAWQRDREVGNGRLKAVREAMAKWPL